MIDKDQHIQSAVLRDFVFGRVQLQPDVFRHPQDCGQCSNIWWRLKQEAKFGKGNDCKGNGEINERLGVYRTVCCGTEIVINPGTTFPDCPKHPKRITIWKLHVEERTDSLAINEAEDDLVIVRHIENRRLYNLATGLRLERWEEKHLHECNLCQAVLRVFLSQPLGSSASSEAA